MVCLPCELICPQSTSRTSVGLFKKQLKEIAWVTRNTYVMVKVLAAPVSKSIVVPETQTHTNVGAHIKKKKRCIRN